MIRKLLITFLLLVIIARPSFEVFINSNKFFDRTYDKRYEILKKQYYSSQYVLKNNSVILVDEAFEAFAGGAFLKGTNPILIVHDHPPLGRYIISFSILIFNNEHTIIIFLFFFSLLGMFLISRFLIDDTIFALIPVAIFVNEPLMFSKIQSTPLPEIIQLPFIFFSTYFFIKYTSTKKIQHAIFTSLLLGCLISIRFFVLGGVMLFTFISFFIITKKFSLFLRFLCTLPASLLVLMVSYSKTIYDNGNILEPIKIQKYIFTYHQSKFEQIATVWDLLLFNKWHTWWGERLISKDPNWNIFWPISTFSTISLALLGFTKKIKLKESEMILLIWVGSYLLMLSSGSVSVRYFVPLVPFLYILSFSLLYKIKTVNNFLKKI